MSEFSQNQMQAADQLVAEIGVDRLILLAHELERRKLAKLPEPAIHVSISPEHWAAVYAYFHAAKWPEEEGAGGVDWRCQAVADAIASGSPEATLLAALRLARKVWFLQPHLPPIERGYTPVPQPPADPSPQAPPDGIEVP